MTLSGHILISSNGYGVSPRLISTFLRENGAMRTAKMDLIHKASASPIAPVAEYAAATYLLPRFGQDSYWAC